MLVKDQLRLQMKRLGISVAQLARRLEVSDQSVRYWLTGRSFPGKRHVPALERELGLHIDFSEGATPSSVPRPAEIQAQQDLELLLLIQKLAPHHQAPVRQLVMALSQGG